ncbi:uncharacterized protein LOC111111127 [Crassostrea virginica]
MIHHVFIWSTFCFLLCNSYEDLSLRKNASQSTTDSGFKASNAVDGDITTCMRTKPIGGDSPYESVWWMVDLGRVSNIYRISIIFKNYEGFELRQRGRFAGFSLYVSNTKDINGSSLCYKNEPQLPPLNFTTTCTSSGRYVIFSNQRLDGVQYPDGYISHNVSTELCEVNVMGCTTTDVYGYDCDLPCPANCRYNICDIQEGSCLSCKSGWHGKYCEIDESRKPTSDSSVIIGVMVFLGISLAIAIGGLLSERKRLNCKCRSRTYEVSKMHLSNLQKVTVKRPVNTYQGFSDISSEA